MPLHPLERIPTSVVAGKSLAKRAARHPGLIHGCGLEAMAMLLEGRGDIASLRGRLDMTWLQVPPDRTANRDIAAWLAALAAQLAMVRKLLRKGGDGWLDIETRDANHAHRLLDAILGAGTSIGETTWQPSLSARRSLLVFRNQAADEDYIQQRFPNIEAATGRRYWLDLATWRVDPAQLERMQADGQVLTSKTGVAYIKRYFTEPAGNTAATPKAGTLRLAELPEEPTLAQILRHACPPGGAVAGFGTDPLAFAQAASTCGLRWTSVGSDLDACVAARDVLRANRTTAGRGA